MPKRKKTPPFAGQRMLNIEEEAAHWLEPLFRNYKMTNPNLGEESEIEKTELAYQSIELWWYLYAKLLLWAQSHIAGQLWAKRNPEAAALIAKEFGLKQLDEDSHLFEYIGLSYVFNRVNEDDPAFVRVSDIVERIEDADLTNEDLRSLVIHLLSARSTESSFWRFPVSKAFYALNYGGSDELIEPSKRMQGDGLKLVLNKLLAVQHVQYLMGTGYKKHAALERVSCALGQSAEAIKSWEKKLKKDEYFSNQIFAARIAGEYEEQLDRMPKSRLPTFMEARFKNVPMFTWCKTALNDLRSKPLESLKTALAETRIRRRSADSESMKSGTSHTRSEGTK
jgi:hypothetical protein